MKSYRVPFALPAEPPDRLPEEADRSLPMHRTVVVLTLLAYEGQRLKAEAASSGMPMKIRRSIETVRAWPAPIPSRLRRFPSRRSTDILYVLALLIEVAVFYRHVLFYPGYLFPWDFRAVHLPLATFVADSLHRGELPLWDPYTYCGNPIYANIQTALFYPPVFAATLMSGWLGAAQLPRLLAVAVAAQVFFAGVCTFALLRRLGVQPAAAWIAGTTYELGCFFASQAEHMGAMHGASWLPLTWLCVVELRSKTRWPWLALLSVALSMTILAGLPQVAVAAFGSAFVLAAALAMFRLGRRTLPLQVLLAWGWALALAAVQFIPTIELTRNSVAKYRADWLKSGGGIKPGALFSLIVPNYWSVFDLSKFHGPSDPTFLYLYSSLLGLALALAAMCWKPGRWTRAFTFVTLATTIWMLGDATPIGRTIFQSLPAGVRIGIHPEYAFCVFSLGLAVLAGYGADRFLRGTRLQILAGVVIAVDLLAVSSGRPFNISSVVAEPGITHDSADGNRYLITRLRALTNTAYPPYRIDTADVTFGWSSTATLTGIPTANGCDPLAPERIIQVRLSFSPGERWGTCYQVVNPSSPVLGLTNARYLLSRTAVSDSFFQLVEEIGAYKIYENTRTLPRFFYANRVRRANSLAEAAKALHAADFNPSEFAVVEPPFVGLESLPETPSDSRADVISYGPSAVSLRTHSTGPAFLVATDTYYPGWEARIDGSPTPLYLTDVAFRGIRVPAGEHRVEMRFVPRILYRSAVLSLCAWLLVAFFFIRSWRTQPDALTS